MAAQGFTSLTVLEAGIDGWHAAGKPLTVAEHKPWSMERHVRIVAGSLVLTFVILSYFFVPLFLLAAAFVGAGLLFAGLTDTCMMAYMLGRMPWNQPNRIAT